MSVKIVDVYLRFEAILYALIAISGFIAPTSMISLFNWNNVLTTEGIIITEGTELHEETQLPLAYYNIVETLTQLLIFTSSIVSAYQSITMLIAIMTTNPTLRSVLVKLNLFLNLCFMIFNGWILATKKTLYTESGLYGFWFTFIFYVVDFFILSFLTEVIPYLTSMKNSALGTTTTTTATKDKKKK